MFKTIVVGTDGSHTASEAVTRAARLAATADAKLHVVTAYPKASSAAWGYAVATPAVTADFGELELGNEQQTAAAEVLPKASSRSFSAGLLVAPWRMRGSRSVSIPTSSGVSFV